MESLLSLQQRKIKITDTQFINLLEQTLFLANGDEGLHLWESSVVFARYIRKNASQFENKEIIELGTGCGLVGMACLLYTKCFHFAFSDYQERVLSNLLNNLKLNKYDHTHMTSLEDDSDSLCVGCIPGRYSILKIDWREYDKFKYESYDFILGSELIYSGGCIEELAKLIRNLLKIDGKCLITMPEKRSMKGKFLEYLEQNGLNCVYSLIEDDELFGGVLEDDKESKKLFENLKSMKIMIYEISRKE